MIPQALTWYATKGGVGKSTHCANHAVMNAAGGWRVLVVDLDPQGNMARLLGFDARHGGADDGGAELLAAFKDRRVPTVLRDVGGRGGLDAVAGGPAAGELLDLLGLRAMQGQPVSQALDEILFPIASDYHLILVDLPPTWSLLHVVALSTVRFVVIPAEPGDLQIDGVAHALNHVAEIQARQNPDLEALGVAVGKYRRGATRRMAEGRADLAALLTDMDAPDVEVFEPWIRHTDAAEEMLRLGRVAIEHERIAEEARRRRFEWLRTRTGEQPPSLNVDGARGLADDYAAVISTVNDRFRARLDATRTTMAAIAEAAR